MAGWAEAGLVQHTGVNDLMDGPVNQVWIIDLYEMSTVRREGERAIRNLVREIAQ